MNPKDIDDWTALPWAVNGGYEKMVELLLEKDMVDVNCKDTDGS